MSLRRELASNHPDFPLLAAKDCDGVADLMRSLGWLEPGESVLECERAGDGNMNLTLRVRTERRSRILKQSRPWVEKYDQIEAPFDRALVEARFYRRVESIPEVAKAMPALLGADDASRALLLEDLGESRDLSSLYAESSDSPLTVSEIESLGAYLRALHAATWGQDPGGLRNREMRRLNHEHIFLVPFREDNGVDLEALEPGLAAVAEAFRGDRELATRAEELGRRYLEDGPCLVHGDFFPGSWLRTDGGLRIIDPEFGFFGDPELDFGVAFAHLALARQPAALAERWVGEARSPGRADPVDRALVARYAAIEIIRRLLGVAQLPLAPSRGFRAAMLGGARSALIDGELEALTT